MTEKELELGKNFVSLRKTLKVVKKPPRQKPVKMEKPKKKEQAKEKRSFEAFPSEDVVKQDEEINPDLRVDKGFDLSDAKKQIMKDE